MKSVLCKLMPNILIVMFVVHSNIVVTQPSTKVKNKEQTKSEVVETKISIPDFKEND